VVERWWSGGGDGQSRIWWGGVVVAEAAEGAIVPGSVTSRRMTAVVRARHPRLARTAGRRERDARS
jgi:hypothetical protein